MDETELAWSGRHPGDEQYPPPRRRRRRYSRTCLVIVATLFLAAAVALFNGGQQAGRRLVDQHGTAVITPRVTKGSFTPDEVDALANKVTPSLVDVETVIEHLGAVGAGTGIVLSSSGDVLTNNHVINGATTIEVVNLGNHRRYPATVVGYDRDHDVAVLRMTDASRLDTTRIGDSDTVGIGDPVLGVGNAGGRGGKPTSAPGVVTALNESINTSDELTGSVEQLKGLIEVAADIRPGDSGGPLINARGEVVGVNTAASVGFKYSTQAGTGYAIPINDAMAIVRAIQSGVTSDEAHVGPTGMLGIAVIGPALQPDGTISPSTQPGAQVTNVSSDSPADAVGLTEGDLIVALDNTPVNSPNDLISVIGRHHPGDRVVLHWVDTGGTQRAATATLAEGPPA